MSERIKFVGRLMEGERMTDLCREFGISRKTGQKLWKRFQAHGVDGLNDRSRRPFRHPNATPDAIVQLIIDARNQYPTWGPKKLAARLKETQPGLRIPAPSTIGEILQRKDLVVPRNKRRRGCYSPTPLRKSKSANDIWCMDYKGQFRLGNNRLCYPLTVSDHFSRYLLGCDALEDTKTDSAQECLLHLFREYGLPLTMRSDNGAPFASTGIFGLSRLSVWLLRLDIRIEHIEPGHPEQNGRHERMHLTLKQETTRPAAQNLLQQQERFDSFRSTYNMERPHESLEMKPPNTQFVKSTRACPEKLTPLEYPLHDLVKIVGADGWLQFQPFGRKVKIGAAFSGERVGFRQVADGTWLTSFMDYELGYLDEQTRAVLPVATPAFYRSITEPTRGQEQSQV